MKNIGNILISLVLLATSLPALGNQYQCNESEGVMPLFTLSIDGDAVLNSDDGQILNTGNYSSHLIGGQTRLTGLRSLAIQTAGGFGEVTLSLVDDGFTLFGNGTVNKEGKTQTVLVDCKMVQD